MAISQLPKCPAGIQGFDEILDGGLPRGRPTLVCGGTGSGKTSLASTPGVSSLMDSWLLLCNRSLFILKSRGMGHSNQVREMVLSDCGINLLDVYVGPHGVLTGSSRLARSDQILAIPTLVRQLPPPVKKIIGDLSDTERVLVGLDMTPLP